MAFGAIEIATIARTQDFTTIKHNEDSKGALMQNMAGQKVQKDTTQKIRQVNKKDEAAWQNKKFDAKDKGSNSYQGDGGKNRKGNPQESIIRKGISGGFDIKV
ncbi:MAG: hypothetical protein IJZ82_08305 [Lachnospiraceae bacterium]|nr:hypothetical protein [Lachnospiraceae bacterium]